MKNFTRIQLILILLSVYSITAVSQQPSDVINPQSINYQLVDKLFNQKLNELRKSKNAKELTGDATLVQAANDHSNYMATNDTLTHFQKSTIKKTPNDRVRFYKGVHDGVGENCLYTYLFKPISGKRKKDTVTIRTYEQLAEQIYISWKNSPGHYKNMIDPKYDVQGISFSYLPKSNKLYSSQVFAMKPYTYPKKIENLAIDYPIKPYSPLACKSIETENINGYRLSNRLIVVANKIYLSLQYPEPFEKAFNDKKDALALDIVFKDQFTCDNNNKLNGSPYYDGIMLAPVSFKEIFSRNMDKKNGRLYSYLCDLPAEVEKMNYQLNVVLIKGSCFCSYTFPVKVDDKNYNLINLQPYWDTINIILPADTIAETIGQKIRFEKKSSSFNPKDLDSTQNKLMNFNPYIRSIHLNAFSSVEGDTALNIKLGKERARNVLEKLKAYVPPTTEIIVSSNENWDLFYKQIVGTKWAYLSELNKYKVKRMIKDSLHIALDSLLSLERYSEFQIDIHGIHNNTSLEALKLRIDESLKKGNFTLAHSLQSKIIYQYLKDSADVRYLSNYTLSDGAPPVPFFINLLAAKCIDAHSDDFNDRIKIKEQFKKFSSSKRAQYNYCIYAIKYWSTNMDTLVHPDALLKLINNCKALVPAGAINSMLLNYYLVSAEYYNYVNEYKKMSNSLNEIYNLFKKVRLDENTSYKLALYFSGYNRTDWTVQLLEPHMKTSTKEPAIHLYLQAGAIEYQRDYKKNYIETLDKYIALFPSQYNSWIKEEYQLLREPIFKTRFCKSN